MLVTEDKYSEFMDVCCEILFICEILFLSGGGEYAIAFYVENVGVIFPSEKILVSRWMKHKDMHHHFIQY